jgi:RNA polymerase sigma-70 factor (ECF subfamily)
VFHAVPPAEAVEVEDRLVHERRLVARMLAGEERAFDEFFGASFRPLYRFALRRVGGDANVAEDVAQRTLCAAIDKLASWRGEAQLLTWLCAICRRELADHFRRERRAGVTIELTDDLPEVRAALESALAEPADPERDTLRQELTALVHVALDHLPPHYARLLEWKYLEDAPVKEMAGRLGSTPKAVESMLTRARNVYRDVLEALLAGRPATTRGGTGHGRA